MIPFTAIDQPVLDVLAARVKTDFESNEGAHDFHHLRRVASLARRIAEAEGADPSVAQAAALVHDYHRLLDDYGVGQPADAALAAISRVLRDCGITDEEVTRRVIECVAFTDKYLCAGDQVIAPSAEAAAVRDADNLDAIGAVGIARALTFGAHLGEPIWVDDEPIRDVYEHGRAPSVIHHFHEKLLHLADEMTTCAGKEIAIERHEYVEDFSRRIRSEWTG
ncbi:MAG: HD domain-containing protein [Nocardiaceae bacterium]|jgi:uncharacterized protein|nr:HD domain-containing protein [Nocardiaceae bacterium]